MGWFLNIVRESVLGIEKNVVLGPVATVKKEFLPLIVPIVSKDCDNLLMKKRNPRDAIGCA